MTQIPLDPVRGLDPHLTYCPRCGGEADELTIGVVRKAQLPDGTWVYANRGQTTQLARKLVSMGKIGGQYDLSWETVTDEHERLPATQPCKTCRAELEEFDRVVKEGGIYFRCASCNANGVIKPDVPLSKLVREKMGIEPPNPCGIEFQKCEEHGGKLQGQSNEPEPEV